MLSRTSWFIALKNRALSLWKRRVWVICHWFSISQGERPFELLYFPWKIILTNIINNVFRIRVYIFFLIFSKKTIFYKINNHYVSVKKIRREIFYFFTFIWIATFTTKITSFSSSSLLFSVTGSLQIYSDSVGQVPTLFTLPFVLVYILFNYRPPLTQLIWDWNMHFRQIFILIKYTHM